MHASIQPIRTEAYAFYRDIPALLGFIVRGFIWEKRMPQAISLVGEYVTFNL